MSWKSFQTDHTVFGIFPAPLVAANMFCSITLNFTVDKIRVKFFVDSEAMVAYNAKKMFAARIQAEAFVLQGSADFGKVRWRQRNRRK